MEPEPAHDMGNNLRSKHRSRAGDFVMFADDDNLYAPDALSTIRTVVHHDADALCEWFCFLRLSHSWAHRNLVEPVAEHSCMHVEQEHEMCCRVAADVFQLMKADGSTIPNLWGSGEVEGGNIDSGALHSPPRHRRRAAYQLAALLVLV